LGNSPGGSSADVVLRRRVSGSEAQALIFSDGGGELQGGREFCSASSLGLRRGTTPHVGLRLGRACFVRGEGDVRVGPLASAGSRPLRLGCAGVGRREWLLGRARFLAGFWPTASLVFKIPFLFPNLFIICKLI
jgi:hypothetical protein